MKIFLVSQDVNNDYDTFDSFVMVAPDEETARNTHPSRNDRWEEEFGSSWADRPNQVKVEYIGEAKEGMEQGIVCASFNAG